MLHKGSHVSIAGVLEKLQPLFQPCHLDTFKGAHVQVHSTFPSCLLPRATTARDLNNTWLHFAKWTSKFIVIVSLVTNSSSTKFNTKYLISFSFLFTTSTTRAIQIHLQFHSKTRFRSKLHSCARLTIDTLRSPKKIGTRVANDTKCFCLSSLLFPVNFSKCSLSFTRDNWRLQKSKEIK